MLNKTADKIEAIDKAILLTEKKVKLLKELKESILYENSILTIQKDPGQKQYFLISNAKKKVIETGTIKTLLKKAHRLGIAKEQIYNPQKVNL